MYMVRHIIAGKCWKHTHEKAERLVLLGDPSHSWTQEMTFPKELRTKGSHPPFNERKTRSMQLQRKLQAEVDQMVLDSRQQIKPYPCH